LKLAVQEYRPADGFLKLAESFLKLKAELISICCDRDRETKNALGP